MALNDLPLGNALGNLAPNSQNFFKNVVFNDCAEEWWVYVETSIPAFIELLVTISFIDLQDIIRWGATEGLNDRAGNSRRRRGRHFRKGTVPDNTPDRTAWRQGTKTLIQLTGIVEKLGLIWLLYSAGDQFFYRWQSLIERFGACNPQFDPGYFARTGSNIGTSVTLGGNGFALPVLAQNTAGWNSSNFSVSLPNGAYRVTLAIKMTVGLLDLPSVGCQINNTGPLGGTLTKSGTVAVRVGETADAVVSTTIIFTGANPIQGIFWEVYGMVSATGVLITEGRVFVEKIV